VRHEGLGDDRFRIADRTVHLFTRNRAIRRRLDATVRRQDRAGSGQRRAGRQLAGRERRTGRRQAVRRQGHQSPDDQEKFKDFQIHLEFWSDEKVNSGLFIRCQDPKAPGAKNCYEVNIFDGRKDPSYGTGAIVNFAEVNPMPKAAGKWNTMEVTAKGRQLVVTLNGQKTVDMRNGMFEEGPFTLQYGSGVLKVRKLAVKRL
jgi:hypothetical protein